MRYCYLRLLPIIILQAVNSNSKADASPINDLNLSISILTRSDENPVQTFDPDIVMQVGAFRNESNATALKDRLSHLLNKPVIIYPADGYFKVRITGFTSQEDIENLIPALGLLGIKNIWVFLPVDKAAVKPGADIQRDASGKAANEKINIPDAAVQTDPALKPVEEKITSSDTAIEKSVVAEQTLSLQVEVFHGKSKALRAQRRIEAKLNLPVVILNEWEYYIVIITGFKTREEISKYYPALAALGYSKSTIIESNNSKKP